MRFPLHLGPKVLVLALLSGVFSGLAWSQPNRQPAAVAAAPREPAAISRVKILLEQDSPAVEILSTHAVVPTITKLDNPQRIVIDLPNARVSLQNKQIEVNREDIRAIRLGQYRNNPPVVRVVVDLLKPHSYTWDTAGNRLVVRLHEEAPEVAAKAPSVPVLTKAPQPVAIPVASASAGTPMWADKLAAGSSMSTTDDTTVLRLTRGGEIHVCPGTSVSIAHSPKGPDLLLGMGTGAVETHYALENSADAIVTPDFRILLRGPGEFHYAIAADSRGNTCVRTLPGTTAPIIVSELMGDGVLKVQPNEQFVFHGGHINSSDTGRARPYSVDWAFPQGCGCPSHPEQSPVMLASLPPTPVIPQTNASAVRLAQPGDEMKPLLPRPGGAPNDSKQPQAATVRDPHAKDVHIQVEARVVYPAPNQSALPQASGPAGNKVKAAGSGTSETSPMLILGPPTQPKQSTGDEDQSAPEARQARKPRRGVFGKIKGFFGKVFR